MTSHVLIIETATEDGSVAIASDGRLAAEVAFASRDPDTGARTESLAPALTQLLVAGGVRASDLTAVVCSAGPGGFTSLRAATRTASAMSPADVGLPHWSATTETSSRVSASRSMVFTKFFPNGLYTQAVRMMTWFGLASAIARSPASLDAP